MGSFFLRFQSALPRSLLVGLILAVCLSGCARRNGGEGEGQQQLKEDEQAKNTAGENFDREKKREFLMKLPSATDYLTFCDLEKFQPGRSASDILKDIQWRGFFRRGAVCEGQSISVIDYDLIPDNPEWHVDEWWGKTMHAIFIEDKFVKFIDWQSTVSRKIDDCNWLKRAMKSKAINIEDVKKELKAGPPKRSTDPGLTIAWLLLRPAIRSEIKRPASIEEYMRNGELCDQFNASRLKIGMTQEEVKSILKAKPLESGKIEAGSYNIYGSNESFNLEPVNLHHRIILGVFKEDKLCGIIAELGGTGWRSGMSKVYTDLPEAKKTE